MGLRYQRYGVPLSVPQRRPHVWYRGCCIRCDVSWGMETRRQACPGDAKQEEFTDG